MARRRGRVFGRALQSGRGRLQIAFEHVSTAQTAADPVCPAPSGTAETFFRDLSAGLHDRA